MPNDAGGAITSNICNVSPSDQAATLDNVLERLQKLETLVSQHLGSNVQVEQLSDISQDLGWIQNVTYLGVEGWTQTPSGTLIPPSGWTGLSNIIDGQSGLSLYVGGSSPGGFNILSSYWADTVTDIAAGANSYINTSGTDSTLISTGDTGLVQGSLGAGTKTGWRSERDTNYVVFAELRVEPGTSAPTSGNFNLVIYDWRETINAGAFVGLAIGPYPASGLGSYEYPTILASAFHNTSSSADSGYIFRVVNKTNGDIRISNLRSTFIKV